MLSLLDILYIYKIITIINNKKSRRYGYGEDEKMIKAAGSAAKNIIIISVIYSSIYFYCSSPLFPPITSVVNSIIQIITDHQFAENMASTMKILGTGVAISFIVGNAVALFCQMSSWIDHIVMPVINFIKNIPSIAMFPAFVVMMGIGDSPRITVIIWNSIYAVVSTGIHSLQSTDKDTIEAAQNAGASKWQTFFYIRIPLAMIDILHGLKISLSNGFIAVVVAEMLGATDGIGYMIIWSANAFQYSEMYAYIIIIAMIGYLLNSILDIVIKKTERKIYE